MTKKDYVAIAEILSDYHPFDMENTAVGDLFDALCKYFKQDNPRFDKEKFMEAVCGK